MNRCVLRDMETQCGILDHGASIMASTCKFMRCKVILMRNENTLGQFTDCYFEGGWNINDGSMWFHADDYTALHGESLF